LTLPVSKPSRNQRDLWDDVPCVKASGNDVAAALALEAVVADRVGRAERLLDVAGLQEVLGLLRVVGPDPREVVGLQLQPHREPVGLRLREPPSAASGPAG
jgi:hypothetical protein